MTRIILVRHGQSEANLSESFAGNTDAPLTAIGKAQAAAVAAYLLDREKIDIVIASDLSRARDTGAAVASRFGIPLQLDPALREIAAGEWEGKRYEYLNAHYSEARALWKTDLKNAYCTGGETLRDVFARVSAALQRILAEHEGKTVLIASHWTPILCAVCYLHGKDLESISDFPSPTNCSLQFFRYENGKFETEALNVTDHLGELHSIYHQA